MAIYVNVNPIVPPQGWSGSHVDIPFDGSTEVKLEAWGTSVGVGSIAAADVDWTLHNAPEGTTFNEAWFIANNGGSLSGVNPLDSVSLGAAFIPDIQGTWFFRVTRTDTAESIDFVIATKSIQTGTRIPATGETNEADQDTTNHAYTGGSPSGQGWAKDRNYALSVYNDLTTSGGIQLCYFEDAIPAGAPFSGSLRAGAAVSLKIADPLHVINHTTGATVPKVILADGDTKYHYVGLVLSGVDGAVTGIPTGTLVWVSRSGVVKSNNSVIDTTGYTEGEILYLSKTVGILQRGTDQFALGANATNYVVPAALVIDKNVNGTVVVLPHEYLGGISDATEDQSFRFVGLGDFRGVRVGDAQAVAVAGELTGAVEMVAQCKEDPSLTAGDICNLFYNSGSNEVYAEKADSSLSASANNKKGIVGIAIQTVALNDIGHFVIYGPADATISGPALAGKTPVFVGSSDLPVAQAGIGVTFEEIAGNTALYNTKNEIIPIGHVDGAGTVLVGFHKEIGFLDEVTGLLAHQATESGGGQVPKLLTYSTSNNKSKLKVQDSAVTLGLDESTIVKVAGSGADDSVVEVDIFESRVSGSDFYDITAGSLAGKTTAAFPHPGAILGTPASPHGSFNTIYATFSFDNRIDYSSEVSDSWNFYENPLRLKVYGYIESDEPGAQLQGWIRFNPTSITGYRGTPLPVTQETPDYPYWTSMLALPPVYNNSINFTLSNYKEICWDIPLQDNETLATTTNSNQGSSAIPSLAYLTPAWNTDTIATSNNSYYKFWKRKPLTVDIALKRVQAWRNFDVVITHAVLECEGRSQISRRRSFYEASFPAYMFTDTAGANNIKNYPVTPVLGKGLGELVGVVNSTGSAAGTGVNEIVGFIPRDSRAAVPYHNSKQKLQFRITGKFAGLLNVAGHTLDLDIKIQEVTEDLIVAAVIPAVATTVKWAPVIADHAGSEEIANSIHEIEMPPPATDDVIGWWFKIERSGTTDVGGTELFYLMSNITLQSKYDNSNPVTNILPVPEPIYEEHVLGGSFIQDVAAGGTYLITNKGDTSGYSMPAAGAYGEFTVALDERYDDKSGLTVDIISCAYAAGGSVEYILESNYSDSKDFFPTTWKSLGTSSVTNTAPPPIGAGDVKFIKHTFSIPADYIWSEDSTPASTYEKGNFTYGKNKGTLRLKIHRTDAEGYVVAILSATIRSDKSNKTNLAVPIPININEGIKPQGSALRDRVDGNYIPGYMKVDSNRSLNLSIQRFTWHFVHKPGTSIAAGAEAALIPGSWSGVDFTPFGTCVAGYLIPYSMAITDIYGWIVKEGVGNATEGVEGGTNKAELSFRLMEVPQASSDATSPSGGVNDQSAILGTAHHGPTGVGIAFPGIQGFPLTVYPDNSGCVRWNASNMNFTPGSGHQFAAGGPLPKIILPHNYSFLGNEQDGTSIVGAGHKWQLTCYVKRNDGDVAALVPLVNLTVEVALLPNYITQNQGSVGGSLSTAGAIGTTPPPANTQFSLDFIIPD